MQDQDGEPNRNSVISENFESMLCKVSDKRTDGQCCNNKCNYIADDNKKYLVMRNASAFFDKIEQLFTSCSEHGWHGEEKRKLGCCFFIKALSQSADNGCRSA